MTRTPLPAIRSSQGDAEPLEVVIMARDLHG
jgi:hypothetical protein